IRCGGAFGCVLPLRRALCSAIAVPRVAPGSMIWFYWISGIALVLIWLVPVIDTALHRHLIADVTRPEWEPSAETNLPSLSIVVPARDEEAEIEEALCSLLALDYAQLEVTAINDRSNDSTGAIMDRLAAEPASQPRLRVI